MRILKNFKQAFRGKSTAWIQLSFGPALWVKRRFNQRGFSLVELMVVVAIIGILASIAIPNYQRFQRKARQSEPRTNLSAIYAAEKVFNTEWNFGATSHAQIGFSVDSGNGLYYSIGWTALGSGPWNASNSSATHLTKYHGPTVASTTDFQIKGPLGGDLHLNTITDFAGCGAGACSGSCTGTGTCTLNTGNTACIVDTAPTSGTWDCASAFSSDLIFPGNGTSRNTVNSWTIGAAGNIGATSNDVWTINQDKTMANVQSGL